jgi:hypothetical protein
MIDPAVNYRDQVDPRHKMAMEAIGFMRQILGQHREQFNALLKSERHMHDVGGLLNPTLYRDMLYSKSFEQQLRLVRAAVAFLNEVDAVANEIDEPEGGP